MAAAVGHKEMKRLVANNSREVFGAGARPSAKAFGEQQKRVGARLCRGPADTAAGRQGSVSGSVGLFRRSICRSVGRSVPFSSSCDLPERDGLKEWPQCDRLDF